MATFLDNLMQDPGFLTGLSLLGGQTNQIAPNILKTQAALGQIQEQQAVNAARQQAVDAAQRRTLFNPEQYFVENMAGQKQFDKPGFLAGAINAGYDLGDVSQLVKSIQPPGKQFTNVAPGGAVLDELGNVIYQAPFKPAESPTAIREIIDNYRAIQALPPGPLRDAFEARQQQVTGAAAQADRQENIELRKAQIKQAEAVSEQNRIQREDQARGNRLLKFTGQLENSGIPQLEKQLQPIEEMLAKYPKGDVPGFTRTSNTLSNAGLGFTLNPQEQANRQMVQSLANVQLKDRSGAAVTNPEWERFKTELGTGSFMSSDRIRQGIGIFRNLVNSTKANLAAGLSDEDLALYNERNPGIRLPARAGKPGGGGITPEAAAAELARRRGKGS